MDFPIGNYFGEFLETMIHQKSQRTRQSITLAVDLHKQFLLEGHSKQVRLSNLKKDWSAWQSPSGRVFYHNQVTNQTTWTAPINSPSSRPRSNQTDEHTLSCAYSR